MTVEDFLSHLEGVSGRAPLWSARCPAHEDRNASMQVRESDDGNILVKCYACCSAQEIVDAMGLTMRDLFVEERREERPVAPPEPPGPLPTDAQVDIWCSNLRSNDRLTDRLLEVRGWAFDALCDLDIGWDGSRLTLPVRDAESGICNLLRYLPSGSPKMLAVRGRRRELWPPPEEFPDGYPLLLVEGETDAITATSLGVHTVSVPGAATWGDDWAHRFAGRRVVVMFDCDMPGRKAAARVRGELAAVTWVRSVDLAPERSDGFDLTDLVLAQRAAGKLDLLQRRLRRLLEG